jgi:hypothetical protein
MNNYCTDLFSNMVRHSSVRFSEAAAMCKNFDGIPSQKHPYVAKFKELSCTIVDYAIKNHMISITMNDYPLLHLF